MLHFLYKGLICSGLIMVFAFSSNGQTVISNIQTDYNSERMKITYDLQKINPQDSIYLQIESKTRGFLSVKTVTGDVGHGISEGNKKVIYWDYSLDGVKIAEEQIRVHIKVFSPSDITTKIGAGPTGAFASILLPGVGNMLVNHKIGLRPLITVSYLGLVGYGLVQRKKGNEQYAIYNRSEFDFDEAGAEPHYQQANKHRRQFYYAAQGAALILAADVIYSAVKGIQNDRLKRSQSRISLHYIGNTPALAYQLTF